MTWAPRWLLVDIRDEAPLLQCAGIDGLFADLPPWPRERFTLVGCHPLGDLASREWLGDVSILAPDRRPDWSGEYLYDVTVHARRPSPATPGAVDLELDGFVYRYDRTDAVERPAGVDEFVLAGTDDEPYGTCRDVRGVFRERAAPPVPQVRLLGARPEPAFGRRRGLFRADVYAIADDGSRAPVAGATVCGTVATADPSPAGPGLLDVTVDSEPVEPLPTGMLGILDLWRAGRPTRTNLWSGYDRKLRLWWAGLALGRSTVRDDRPAGTEYNLDGRFVTDIEGFYCAIGEAVNGPGGYFGWNLDALHDCLNGQFGARPPFRLVWHHAEVAREHLVAGYDRRRPGPAVTLDELLELLVEHRVEVDLR